MKTFLIIFFLLISFGICQASDAITSATQNPDGSWTFGFIFDGGNGNKGVTYVKLPAPIGTPEVVGHPYFPAITNADGTVTPAQDAVSAFPAIPPIPYTIETAKAAVLPIASEQKSRWINNIGSSSILGDIVLP